MPELESWVRYSPVHNFPNYQVSTDGKVWTCYQKPIPTGKTFINDHVDHTHWRELKLIISKQAGYVEVCLHSNGKQQTAQVHSLVTRAFLGERPKGWHTRHLDGIKTNNNIDNLCYGTAKENIHDKFRHGTMPLAEKHFMVKLTREKIAEILEDREKGMSYGQLVKKHQTAKTTIARIIKNQHWSTRIANSPS